jgi:phosphoglycolate phosphatase
MSFDGVTVCFDMDGTLVDTAPDLVAAMNHVLKANGFDTVAYDNAKTMIGQGAAAMIKSGLDLLGEQVSVEQLRLMESAFAAHYDENFAEKSAVFGGADLALRELRNLGCNLVVCSNTGEQLVNMILTEFGLRDYFRTICGGDTTEHKKPDPRPLQHVVSISGGTSSRSVMVGDSETDIEAAKRADMPVIAFDFGYSKTPVNQLNASAVLSSYTLLPATISDIMMH